MVLRARQFELRFPRPTLVMGILNVTPDSFFDGGRFLALDAAVAHAREMVAEGAEIIDVGGESTRPFATPVEEEEELRRVLPVVEALAGELAVPISIDTRKTAVARAALSVGASLVNDVGASRPDAGMDALVAEAGAAYVVMHSQGTPRTMQLQPAYTDVVGEVGRFFERRAEQLAAAGVSREQLLFDVGIGFGKTAEHNHRLLARLVDFGRFGRPQVLGVSRKSFLGAGVEERLPGALACACWAVQAGVQVVRVHDVGATTRAVRLTETLMAHRKA